MTLTENEKILFDLLEPGATVSLTDMSNELGCSRHAAIVRLKYLSAKVAPSGWIITRETGVGRGVKANYKMERKF